MNIFFIFITVIHVHFVSSHIEWCEYWKRMGQKKLRPECQNTVNIFNRQIKRYPQYTPDNSHVLAAKCSENETWACSTCESTCEQSGKGCSSVDCTKSCICSTGFVRDFKMKKCINFKDCESSFGVMKSVKEMIPLIIRDVWLTIFSSVRRQQLGNRKDFDKWNSTEAFNETNIEFS